MEKTLVIIKPDGIRRHLMGEIIRRYEEKGLFIDAMWYGKASKATLAEHYLEHEGKPFYQDLMAFMMSGDLLAMVIKGPNAVSMVRKINGATDPDDADLGSIRGRYSWSKTENLVHGSDSLESAEREIKIWFK